MVWTCGDNEKRNPGKQPSSRIKLTRKNHEEAQQDSTWFYDVKEWTKLEWDVGGSQWDVDGARRPGAMGKVCQSCCPNGLNNLCHSSCSYWIWVTRLLTLNTPCTLASHPWIQRYMVCCYTVAIGAQRK